LGISLSAGIINPDEGTADDIAGLETMQKSSSHVTSFFIAVNFVKDNANNSALMKLFIANPAARYQFPCYGIWVYNRPIKNTGM
jgi:hypothetical protein